MIKLRVSNIHTSASKHDLERLFEEYGDVDSVKMFRTPGDGPSLAFVIMFEEREGQAAMDALQDEDFMGSMLQIEESHDIIVKKKKGVRPKPKAISLDDDDDDSIGKEIISKNSYQGSEDDLKEKDSKNSDKWAILKKKEHANEVGREEYSYDNDSSDDE